MAACGSTQGQTTSGASSSGGGSAQSSSSGLTGTGGGSLFDGGGSGGNSGTGGGCGSVLIKSHPTPANIVVVLDQSNSMGAKFNMMSTPKWQAAEDAIVAAITPIEKVLNLGAVFFPTSSCKVLPIDQSPQIKIEDGPSFLKDFQGHFSDPKWSTIGSTPIKLALDEADAAFPEPSPFPGARAVVVLTDGAPTCNTDAMAIEAPVASMFARGIKTHVIGLPGSQGASALLNGIAAAGGTNMFLTPADTKTLEDELKKIVTDSIDQCTIELDPAPTDPSMVHLFVTDAQNPKGKEVPEGAGWTLSKDGKTATLDGALCDEAKAGKVDALDFVYGCAVLPH